MAYKRQEYKAFQIYLDKIDAFRDLSAEELHRVFWKAVDYAQSVNRDGTQETPDLSDFSRTEKMLFLIWKADIDRDSANYYEKCEGNRTKALERQAAVRKALEQMGVDPSKDTEFPWN